MAALGGVTSAVLLAGPSHAATFAVTNADDSGAGSLRQAITDANANGNNATVDEIPINVTGDIELLTALPNLSTPMTITGPGADSLDVQPSPTAAAGTRLFVVSPAATLTVTIEGVSISDGTDRALLKGGAGALVLDAVWLRDNQTTASGGAVHCDGGALSLRNSTLSGNQAAFGGALSVSSNMGAGTACVADVVNSTLSGNSVNEFGGGIYVSNAGQITINSSTIQGNTADLDDAGGGSGGGSYKASAMATITVANTLYAGNSVGTATPVANQCGGAHTSAGYNFRQTSELDCTGFTQLTDIVNADPKLGTLGDHGGPTPTIPLLEGSPAIDKGNPTTPGGVFPACPAEDQRGALRVVCDIGAFELLHPTTTSVACVPTSVTLGPGTTCTATVTDTTASPTTPTLSVDFSTDGAGTFSGGGSCTLADTASQASCQVIYTPSAVGTGSHEITGLYGGDPAHEPSQGSVLVGVLSPPVTPPVTPPTGTTAPAPFNLAAAIKKCKKKFPKGKKRKKCIKRAKKRAGV